MKMLVLFTIIFGLFFSPYCFSDKETISNSSLPVTATVIRGNDTSSPETLVQNRNCEENFNNFFECKISESDYENENNEEVCTTENKVIISETNIFICWY